MAKENNGSVSERKDNFHMWPTGYIAGILIEVTGLTILLSGIAAGSLGFILVGLGAVVPVVGTLLFKRNNTRWSPLNIAGVSSLLLALVMLADMHDESTGKYSGGFDAGNGFLFDGLGTLIYVFTVPFFVAIGYALLISSDIRKRK